jgi:2-oxoglutarate ferredoxin oxidoreductase subunit delta
MSAKGSITIDFERCKSCELCIEFCPKKSISVSGLLNQKGYFVAVFSDDGACTGCGTCAIICPEVAIEVFKE